MPMLKLSEADVRKMLVREDWPALFAVVMSSTALVPWLMEQARPEERPALAQVVLLLANDAATVH